MKITEYSSTSKTSAKKKTSSSSSVSGGDFLGLLSSGETDTASAATPMGDIGSIGSVSLLSLQEMPEDEIQKRKALAESKFTLEALETLRLALLTGSVPEHLLHTLGNAVALQKQRVSDPHLMNIIEDIELRAAVELAKLERASQPRG